MKKTILTLGALLIVALTQAQAEQERLRYVIDGDTVQFSHTTCRLAFIDTPESKANDKAMRDIQGSRDVSMDDVVYAGRIAKNFLQSVMQKGRVYEFDVTTIDRYGRSVCIIYDEGHNLNEEIVENGFAVPFWKYLPRNKKRDMENLVRHASDNNKGLWRVSRPLMETMNGGGAQRGNGYVGKARNFIQEIKEEYRANSRGQENGYDDNGYANNGYEDNGQYDNRGERLR